MLSELKNKLGYFIFQKKMLKGYDESNTFNDFVGRSLDYLIILPLNDTDFANSFDVVKYFKIHKKEITLFLPEHKVNTISISSNYRYLSYGLNDVSKFGLPSKSLLEKLNERKFDVLVDLERENNLFLAAVAALVKANFKVGFKKPEIENLYNFQMVNTKINSEISYRNLLISLKMF